MRFAYSCTEYTTWEKYVTYEAEDVSGLNIEEFMAEVEALTAEEMRKADRYDKFTVQLIFPDRAPINISFEDREYYSLSVIIGLYPLVFLLPQNGTATLHFQAEKRRN